ncbi:MAG: HDOD domain-containing protein [Candidatus Hydrogenedentes bacterium]|nr:HDOD domain-containing protein [Candidatus Hydrogenedentota bacterium]
MTGTYNIDTLLDGIVTLPSLPSTVNRVTHLVNAPDSSLSDVAKALQTDPALAIKTLRLVNSAYYGLANKIISVDHAVALLGMKVIKNLVFTATVFETFNKGTGALLRHSVSCGVVMRTIIPSVPGFDDMDTEEAFVYGLLHDVGKIIFEQFLPKEVESAILLSRTRGIPVFEAERYVIGVDHAELGGHLAQRWGLSKELVAAISGHHNLAACTLEAARPLAATLAIADFICNACAIVSVPGATPYLPEEMWGTAGIPIASYPRILHAFFDSLGTVDELIELQQ